MTFVTPHPKTTNSSPYPCVPTNSTATASDVVITYSPAHRAQSYPVSANIAFPKPAAPPWSEAFETMLASEEVLRRDWDTPEEDEAWAHL